MAKRRAASHSKASRVSAKGKALKKSGKVKSENQHRQPLNDDSAGGNGFVQSSSPIPKTPLSPEELDRFKDLLIQKRHQLMGDVDRMEDEALGNNRTAAAGDLSMMPIHMADIGTDNYEQEFTIGLIESQRDVVKEIDAALERIQNGTYGICLKTHQPVSMGRLQAKPWARYCIEYKRASEHNKKQ